MKIQKLNDPALPKRTIKWYNTNRVQRYYIFLTYARFWGRKFILLRFSRFPDTKKYISLHIFEVCDVAAFLKFASFDTRCVANVVCQKRAR